MRSGYLVGAVLSGIMTVLWRWKEAMPAQCEGTYTTQLYTLRWVRQEILC